jgi:aminoglycoside/choline kinase family phosphotransferase
MSPYNDNHIITLATELLQDTGVLSTGDLKSSTLSVEIIASDGSTRRFWRFSVSNNAAFIVAAPLTTTEAELKESRAAYYIGKHLFEKGCSVPEIFGWHEKSGLLVFEDLGNERLHDVVVPAHGALIDVSKVREFYRKVICKLAHMQVEGAVAFDSKWCWDGGHYNKELMQERESGYFAKAFWVDLLGQVIPDPVLTEFDVLAERAAEAASGYFLHRDFQSRNIMIAGGEPKFIDFQGGRFGPLGYDLASLLIDPYSALDSSLQEEFLDMYISEVSTHIELDSALFRKEFQVLALQRNLQIIGAFSFLSQVRGKSFFAGFLKPALQSAQQRLTHEIFADMPHMKKMIDQSVRLL